MESDFSLEREQVRRYWQAQSPELASIFDKIEQREGWVVDLRDDDMAARLVRFGERLRQRDTPAILLDADRMDLLVFLVFVSTSKAFRLLDYLNKHHKLGDLLLEHVLGQELINKSVDDFALAQALADRFRVVMNASYCRRILNPQRINHFLDAVREYREYQEERETC